MTLSIVYDCETYPNVFTLAAEHSEYPMRWQFEISPWRNDSKAIIEFCYWIKQQGGRMVGFNNIGFDYPLLHMIVNGQGKVTPTQLYNKAQAIISSMDGSSVSTVISASSCKVRLYCVVSRWFIPIRGSAVRVGICSGTL